MLNTQLRGLSCPYFSKIAKSYLNSKKKTFLFLYQRGTSIITLLRKCDGDNKMILKNYVCKIGRRKSSPKVNKPAFFWVRRP